MMEAIEKHLSNLGVRAKFIIKEAFLIIQKGGTNGNTNFINVCRRNIISLLSQKWYPFSNDFRVWNVT